MGNAVIMTLSLSRILNVRQRIFHSNIAQPMQDPTFYGFYLLIIKWNKNVQIAELNSMAEFDNIRQRKNPEYNYNNGLHQVGEKGSVHARRS